MIFRPACMDPNFCFISDDRIYLYFSLHSHADQSVQQKWQLHELGQISIQTGCLLQPAFICFIFSNRFFQLGLNGIMCVLAGLNLQYVFTLCIKPFGYNFNVHQSMTSLHMSIRKLSLLFLSMARITVPWFRPEHLRDVFHSSWFPCWMDLNDGFLGIGVQRIIASLKVAPGNWVHSIPCWETWSMPPPI